VSENVRHETIGEKLRARTHGREEEKSEGRGHLLVGRKVAKSEVAILASCTKSEVD
jgi:hypothetical protein